MKKFITFLGVCCIFASQVGITQDLGNPAKEKNKYTDPNSYADNINYWVELAREGIIPFNASIPVKPAEFINSRVKGDPIDQMSTDVCLWNETGVTQSENSIFADPDNASYVLNSNNSEQSGSIYGANYIISSNAGQSWAGTKQGAGGSNSGDPAACIGSNGRHYVGFITNAGGQGIAWSDNGTTWTQVGIATSTYLLDKNHLMVDTRASGTYSGYLYSAWTRIESGHVNDADIEFSRSTNNGASWSAYINISNAIAAGSHNQGVNIQTGPSGQVYAVWVVYDNWGPSIYNENAIGFAKSTNGGSSFGAPARIHNNIKGIRPSPYTPTTNATGKNMRVNSFPSMAVDISGGPYNGYIYVTWANVGVPGTNTGTNVSIYCMRSTDGGTTWGTPVRVNQGTSANDYASFFPWISCDQVTGKLFCVFYDDRRLGSASTACEVWVASSEDGGVTWGDFRVGDVSFTPAPIAGLAGGYFGDYLGMTARDGWVYPCWTDNRSGRALSYVSPIRFTDYCIATGGCDEYISNVQIGSINNSSACEGYQNFTNLSTSIPVNSSAVLTVTNGIPYGSDQCGVWVDWNNDGDFVDTGEAMTVAVTPGTGPYTATIAPPVGTTQGTKTMRIRIMYTGTLSPCGNTTYGEVEDYSINVGAPLPNVWDGSFNQYWHNANNWSLNHIPTADEPVEIPNVGLQPVLIDFYDEACLDLNLGAGATLNIYDQALTVNGVMNINGTLGTLQDNATINAMSDVAWNSGSSWNGAAYSAFFNVYGNWNFNAGANVNPAQGFVDFEGAVSNWIRCYSSTSSFYILRVYKTGGAAAKVSNLCTNDLVINGLTFVNSGAIFQSLSNYNLVMNGTFNYYGTFDFTQNSNTGSVIFDGSTQGINNFSSGSGIFNNVVFSSSVGTTVTSGDLIIAKNLTINQGYFNSGSVGITIGGNWTNTVGLSGYVPGTSTIVFHSQSGASQDVSGNSSFYNIIQDNTGQYLRFMDDNTIQSNLELHYFCWAYKTLNVNGILNINDVASKFTSNGPTGNVTANSLDQGGSLVCNGSGATITVNDLVDNAIVGKHYVNDAGCTLNLTNSGTGTYVDLNGELHNFGGTINITGSISYWPYTSNAVVEMTGGVIDFKTCGITIYNSPTYTLNDNITGGIIRTASYFSGGRADFTPTAGTFEFYGPTDSYISQSNGCTLYNVNINKSSKELTELIQGVPIIDERSGENMGPGSKSNNVLLSSNFTITNNLTITAGSFNLNGFQANVNNFCDVYGSLVMTNAADKLYAGTGSYDNLTFYNGSNSTLTAGAIYPASWIWSQAGASITSSSGNTIFFTGSNITGIEVDGAGATFGNVDVNKTSGNLQLFSFASPTELMGYLNLHAGNVLDMQNSSMIIHGVATDNATSTIYLYNGPGKGTTPISMTAKGQTSLTDNGAKGGSLVIDTDFTLNGLMDVADGNVLLHGIFHLASTGNLNITSGSFIADSPLHSKGWEYIDGHISLTSGLFEISHNSINFSSSATTTISGGIVRSGEAFAAQFTGTFQPSGGTVEIVGVGSNTIYCNNGNYFYHLLINRDPGSSSYLYTDITVKNNLTIQSGKLNSFDGSSVQYNIYIGGNWTNNVGSAGFGAGTGTVFFNGTGALNHQFINGTTTFNNIENAKSGGGQLNIAGPVTVANNYLANGTNIISSTALTVNGLLNLATGELGLTTSAPNVIVNNFTMGGVLSVTNGNFTCTDITNPGLLGTINIYGGVTNIYQDGSQYIDMNANLNISGGVMNVYGTSGGNSVWPYTNNASITMSNGVLDFKGIGIYINTSYNLTENITGGTIRTVGGFQVARNDFTPTGGAIELYGGIDAPINTTVGSNIYNLTVNKSGGTDNLSNNNDENNGLAINKVDQPKQGQSKLLGESDRPKMPDNLTDANTAYTSGILLINGTITVDEGTFQVINYVATCMNNINVNAGGILNIAPLGVLKVENTRILNVNNSGWLSLTGNSSNLATITHNTGYYALKVLSGGTIGAVYGVFEYMDLYGIYLYPGSLVDPVNSFNNCTFRYQNPVANSSLFTIGGTQVFTASNASFPINTGANTYNVWKSDNAGDITFFNASGAFAGPEFEYDPYSHVQWTMTPYTVSLTVFLEGPFNTSTNLMNTSINTVLPLGQPYGTPPPGNPTPDWLYTGTESVGSIPSPSIVDWVEVQLRDATTAAGALPARVIARKVGFLLNNGVVVGLDGLNPLSFNSYFGHNLYAVVWHRNHLGVLSASSLTPVSGGYSYNFSSGPGQAYTTGIPAQKLLATGIYGMKSGDGTGNGLVETTDKTIVWSTQAGKTGYREGDYNMNSQVNNPDKDDKWLPNLGSGSFIPE